MPAKKSRTSRPTKPARTTKQQPHKPKRLAPADPRFAQSFAEKMAADPTVKKIGDALNTILDPEIGIGIVDLGLVYDAKLEEFGNAIVTMTLTSMACPAGPQIIEQIETMLPELMPEIEHADVEIVWDPPWGPDKMNPDLRDMLFSF